MSDGAYDNTLLQRNDTTAANGRKVLKAIEKQNKQFYDADLLKEYDEQERQRQTAPASHSQTDLENGGRPKEDYALASTPSSSKPRWYKTRNGIIAIIVIAIIVLGAVIGGAVGGTRGHSSNKSTQTTITSISSSTDTSSTDTSSTDTSSSNTNPGAPIGTSAPGNSGAPVGTNAPGNSGAPVGTGVVSIAATASSEPSFNPQTTAPVQVQAPNAPGGDSTRTAAAGVGSSFAGQNQIAQPSLGQSTPESAGQSD